MRISLLALVAAAVICLGSPHRAGSPLQAQQGVFTGESRQGLDSSDPRPGSNDPGQQSPNGGSPDGPSEEPAEPQAPEPATPEDQRMDLAGTVEGMVEAQSVGGAFKVRDEKLKKDWKLVFKSADPEKVVLIGEDKAMVPAELTTVDGAHRLLVDFHLKKAEEGGFEKEKVLIREVDGKARFAYDKDFNQIPPKPAGPRKKGKGTRKKGRR